jgi:uncharacterized protein YukE
MKQTRAFVPSKGGNRLYYCLQNVRLGFSIPPLYDDAWTAWQNTEQHKNRTIPTGVDVPLYYSFTATIGGVRKNWGHINVRYRDGRVWNDGQWFANLGSFERHYSNVSYVGWGESVNKVKVIEKGVSDMFQNTTEVQQAYQMLRGRNATAAEAQSWVGQSRQRFFVVAKPEADGYRTHTANLQTQVNNLTKQVADLAKSVTALTAEVNKLKTQNTEMEKAIKIKDNEITRLNKELESCGGSQNNSDISHIREVVDKIWAKISSIFK